MQRTNLELDSFKDKIKENQEKIKLNKQLPYLVGNIVEVIVSGLGFHSDCIISRIISIFPYLSKEQEKQK